MNSTTKTEIDTRDLFIAANPTGLVTADLEKGRSGFVDFRTHADYLIFLSGYQAAAEAQAEPTDYPPCDYCGIVPDYHPWHGSGALNGEENLHIHACNECRGKLPPPPNSSATAPINAAASDLIAERQRQVDSEGYSSERDDQYVSGELADAAAAYAFWARSHNLPFIPKTTPPATWPWTHEHWKPTDQRHMLIKAGALILAEIERLDRLQARELSLSQQEQA